MVLPQKPGDTLSGPGGRLQERWKGDYLKGHEVIGQEEMASK